MIDGFAELTGNRHFIHVDPERATETLLGGTIAHGFLTLSLLTAMAEEALLVPAGQEMAINYGFVRVRHLAPDPAGGRIRAQFRLADVSMRSPKEAMLGDRVTVELEGVAKPALVADRITLVKFG